MESTSISGRDPCSHLDRLQMVVSSQRLSLQVHRGQKRADGADYSEHPAEVVENLIDVKLIDGYLLAAGYLHDSLEKGRPDTRSRISAEFGPQVLMLVDALTDPPDRESEGRRVLQLERAAAMPLAARQIKLADRLANLRSPRPDWNLAQRKRYAIHSYALLEALNGTHPVLEMQVRQRLSLPAWRL
jgi:(p)ppGpp synthase/HD superfamily hydrolase